MAALKSANSSPSSQGWAEAAFGFAAAGEATVIVSHWTYSYLRRDCGGDKRATIWLADLAKETGLPIAVRHTEN